MEMYVTGKIAIWFENGKTKIIRDPGILVENGRIVKIGKQSKIKKEVCGHNRISSPSGAIIPSFYNTHTHTGMNLYRGFADDVPLTEWLNDRVWPAEKMMDAEDVRLGAMMAAIECARTGTAGVASMYWHPDQEARAFTEVGVRACVGFPILEGFDVPGDPMTLFDTWHGKNGDLIRVGLCPHAPYTVSSEGYYKAEELRSKMSERTDAGKVITQTHLAETAGEADNICGFLSQKGDDYASSKDWKTPVEYMHQAGLLHEDMVLAHCVHLTDDDIKHLAGSHASVALNLQSNLKLGSGIPRIVDMIRAGVKLSIGTDSVVSNNSLDMFIAARFVALVCKGLLRDPTVVPAAQTLEMATRAGAEAIGWQDGGVLKEGALADFAVLDLERINLLPLWNDSHVASHMAYSATGSDVRHNIIAGKLVIEDWELKTVDETRVREEFLSRVAQLKERVEATTATTTTASTDD